MIDGLSVLYRPALFLHIQKTAGTTMVALAQQHYGRDNVVSHGDFIVRHGLFLGAEDFGSEHDVAVKSPRDYSNIPFVSGHFGYDYAKPLMAGRFSFTFLRDPIDRILSLYFFCKTRDPNEYGIYDLAHRYSLNEFLHLGRHNPEARAFIWNNQTWQLASGIGDSDWRETLSQPPTDLLRLAVDHLNTFSHIGFAETFEKDRDHVLQSLGMPIPARRIVANANPSRPDFNELPMATKTLLYELTELDRQLYEIAWEKYKRGGLRGKLSVFFGRIGFNRRLTRP